MARRQTYGEWEGLVEFSTGSVKTTERVIEAAKRSAISIDLVETIGTHPNVTTRLLVSYKAHGAWPADIKKMFARVGKHERVTIKITEPKGYRRNLPHKCEREACFACWTVIAEGTPTKSQVYETPERLRSWLNAV